MVGISVEAPALVREPSASTRTLDELLIALERAGVSREQFARAARLCPERLPLGEGRMLYGSLYAALAAALEVSGDPAFGLHWGESLNARSFNIVTDLIGHASCLRHALTLLFEFGELLSDTIGIELIERGDEATLRGGDAPNQLLPVRRLVAEVVISGLQRAVREFCPRGRIRRACFDYAAPNYRAEYTRVFGSVVCFDQPFNGLVFDREMLDAPSSHVDEDIHCALRSVAERRLSLVRQGGTYSHRVHMLLIQHRAPQRIPMSAVASRLKISERSLYRNIADEGTSYRAIVDACAASVAKSMLQQERRTIQETAYLMGFSEVTAFHRAFKRWTGTTPRRARSAR